jgi:hypothetical protein
VCGEVREGLKGVPIRFRYNVGADGSHLQLPGLWQRRRLLGSPPVSPLGHLLHRLIPAARRSALPARACSNLGEQEFESFTIPRLVSTRESFVQKWGEEGWGGVVPSRFPCLSGRRW